MRRHMSRLLERVSGFIPAVIALTLPIAFLPSAGDNYILPRASIVIGGASLGVGVALIIPRGPGLAGLRLPLAAAAAAAVLAFIFSISWPLSVAGSRSEERRVGKEWRSRGSAGH